MGNLKKALRVLAQEIKYVFAWVCPSPPNIMDWQSSTKEDLENYVDIIDYLQEHAVEVEPQEMFKSVRGGEQQILDDLCYGSVYDEYAKIEDDYHISWFKSKYPDGTPVYFHTHSGIEHVYEPVEYMGVGK